MAFNSQLLPALAAFGLVFGSFTTALSYRLPKNQSIARGRSRCASCGHELKAPDLVPVLSWVVQRGRCRYCRAKISPRYPIIETVTMALFIAAGLLVSDIHQLIVLLLMTPVLVALVVTDLEHRRLPNSLLVVLAVLAMLWRVWGDGGVGVGIITAASAFVVVLALDGLVRGIMHRPGLGMGDAKLIALAGLALPVEPFLLFSGLAGALGFVWGGFWLWRKSGNQFPFAPAVVAALWISLASGENLLQSIVIFFPA